MVARLIGVFVVAAFAGGQINRGIYRLAYNQRNIGPWSPPPDGVLRRRWLDRVPIIGWWFLRRESQVHGSGYWVRPLLIELTFPTSMCTLYWFEMNQGLLPIGAIHPGSLAQHIQFISHGILFSLLVVATFIDLDEKTIPDGITVPGTMIGLALAALFPHSLLPAWKPMLPPIDTQPLWVTMPNDWPPALHGTRGLAIGLCCLLGWCYAILPKTLWYRGGLTKFIRYLVASIIRHPHTRWVVLWTLLVAAGVVARWWLGGAGWQGLLTALIGMAGAGGIVWCVRVIASPILGQEAMGFGDVTLMAMIGTFVGWQSSVMIFFIAPFTGVLIALAQWMLTGRRDIAYGPFLCAATVLVVASWPAVWSRWGMPIFGLGWFVPCVIIVCLVFLGLMLWLLRLIKGLAGLS